MMFMPHFQVEELVDRATHAWMGDEALGLFNPKALAALENLWVFFNRIKPCAITVNTWLWGGRTEWRGYRTQAKAIELGSPKSEHAAGNAFDCTISGFSAAHARQLIVQHQADPLLLNITRLEADVSWLHFDCKKLPPHQKRIYVFKA
jgi:hypothetical protein